MMVGSGLSGILKYLESEMYATTPLHCSWGLLKNIHILNILALFKTVLIRIFLCHLVLRIYYRYVRRKW